MSNKSSTNAEKHPYQKLAFWRTNKFWKRDLYTKRGQEMMDDFLARMEDEEKRPFILDQKAA